MAPFLMLWPGAIILKVIHHRVILLFQKAA